MSAFDTYRSEFAARPPSIEPSENQKKPVPSELTICVERCEKPDASRQVNDPNQFPDPDARDRKFIWLALTENTIAAEEFGADVCSRLGLGADEGLKHTNLSGGGVAYAGGEAWFVAGGNRIAINGKSGRYPCRNQREWTAIVEAFQESGYTVWPSRWDPNQNRPLKAGMVQDRPWAANSEEAHDGPR
jgi:hypothetical protein